MLILPILDAAITISPLLHIYAIIAAADVSYAIIVAEMLLIYDATRHLRWRHYATPLIFHATTKILTQPLF